MRSLKVLFLLTALLGSQCFADGNCKAVEIKSPVFETTRHQGNTQWCYAYADADLLSFKIGQRVSALDLVLGAKSSNASIDFQKQGSSVKTMRDALANGVCLEEKLPSEGSGDQTIDEAITSKFRGEGGLLRQAQQRACSSRVSVSGLRLTSDGVYGASQSAKAMAKINTQLAQGNVAGIMYDQSVLWNSSADKSDAHTAIVIGKKPSTTKPGKCDYLVRSSLNLCAPDDFACVDEDRHTGWVDGESLQSAMLGYEYLN